MTPLFFCFLRAFPEEADVVDEVIGGCMEFLGVRPEAGAPGVVHHRADVGGCGVVNVRSRGQRAEAEDQAEGRDERWLAHVEVGSHWA